MPIKTVFPALIATLGLVACGGGGTPQEQIDRNISKLVAACSDKGGDYSGAAGLVAYTGSDRDRKFKSLASAEGEDRSILNKQCYQISKLLDGGKSYTLVKFEQETESEGTWYIQHMSFPSGATAALAFLEIDGTFALADID
ncbi:MAG: hypothetical protein KDI71_00380 [Xanthomonadales bacterium]|nr:hypothetical protein [Xanthomonadales bacterium]